MSRQDVLVTADWAEKNLGTDGIVFLEVDEDTTAYDGGHLPGAVKINWTTELQDQVRRDIVDKEQFEQLLSAKGVGNDDTVVLYGGNNNWFAAYAYWQFKLYGHADVKLLDGGRKKWELDGRTLTTDVAERPATTYTAQDPDLSIRAFRDEVVDAIGTKNLVDVRSPDEFSGKILAPAHLPQEQSQRPGHVPVGDQHPVEQGGQRGRHLQVRRGARRALRRGRATTRARPTIAYCRIGERSSHTWVVLHELLGHSDVKNYDGSWTEYGSLIGVPIELGAPSGRLMCGAPDQARRAAARHRPDQGDRARPGGSSPAASRSAARSSGCWTAPASSPPRSWPRPAATSGSSPPPAPGPCARCPAPATARPS